MKTLILFLLFCISINAMETEGHIQVLNTNGDFMSVAVRLYSMSDLVNPIKTAYSNPSNPYLGCSFPSNSNFAFDTASDWDPCAQWTSPNHVLPGIYRLRIEDYYVVLTITQAFCDDFYLKYQNNQFSVISITNPQYVQVSETRYWDVPITFNQTLSNNNSAGQVGVWIENGFQFQQPGYTFYLPTNDWYQFLADTNIISNEKYHRYADDEYVNFREILISDEAAGAILASKLNPFTNTVVLRNSLENTSCSAGILKYSDP